MIKFSIYRGDTFSKRGWYRNPRKKLIDLTGTSFASWVETPDKSFRYDLNVTIDDQTINTGSVTFAAVSTLSWPIGTLNLYIRRTVAAASVTLIEQFKVLES